jgi:hypothetical protein
VGAARSRGCREGEWEGRRGREAREEGDGEPNTLVKESEPKGGDTQRDTKERKKVKLLDRVFSDVFLPN